MDYITYTLGKATYDPTKNAPTAVPFFYNLRIKRAVRLMTGARASAGRHGRCADGAKCSNDVRATRKVPRAGLPAARAAPL
ncbi:MAG: hypothetical protein DBX40_05735 [Clostridiales bacterium]|nr:MAG: hypothetical protein DBX40_05735 [Clostridiales bacterium]